MIGLLHRGTRRPHPNPFPLPLGRLPGLIDSRELHLCNLKVLRHAVEVGGAAGDGHLEGVAVKGLVGVGRHGPEGGACGAHA